jgi:hypothetical protein
MPANRLPHEIDTDKLAEAALAILSLTLHDDGRVWKGLDWDLMEPLREKGWMDVKGGQRREANRMRQRGVGGSGRRAFRSASTSSHGRAAFASSSKVSSRFRMMRSISGVTGESLSSASAAPGRVGRTGMGLLMGLGYGCTTQSATGRR